MSLILRSLSKIACRERHLPKLNVAGSIPVSRSKKISSLQLPVSICAPFVLRSHHQKAFSSWLTAGSLLSTGDCR
jgi:hypothetical protein